MIARIGVGMPIDPGTASLVSSGVSLLSGLFGSSAQDRANRRNIQLARENRQWQEMMSNTAVRRRFADLDAAGVNPLLAGQYDATTPPGSYAQIQSTGLAGVQSAAMGAASARDVMSLDRDLTLLSERIGLTENQKDALGLVAEASGNARDFLAELIKRAKEFDWDDLDLRNMWQEFTGNAIPAAIQGYFDLLMEHTPLGWGAKRVEDMPRLGRFHNRGDAIPIIPRGN